MKHCRVPASGVGASAGLRGFDFAHDSDTCSSDALKSRADCLNLRCDPSVSSHLRLPNLAPHTWQFASVVDRYYYLYAAPKCACPWQRPKTDSSGATHSWTCMPESQECRIPAAAHLKTCCCTLAHSLQTILEVSACTECRDRSSHSSHCCASQRRSSS